MCVFVCATGITVLNKHIDWLGFLLNRKIALSLVLASCHSPEMTTKVSLVAKIICLVCKLWYSQNSVLMKIETVLHKCLVKPSCQLCKKYINPVLTIDSDFATDPPILPSIPNSLSIPSSLLILSLEKFPLYQIVSDLMELDMLAHKLSLQRLFN